MKPIRTTFSVLAGGLLVGSLLSPATAQITTTPGTLPNQLNNSTTAPFGGTTTNNQTRTPGALTLPGSSTTGAPPSTAPIYSGPTPPGGTYVGPSSAGTYANPSGTIAPGSTINTPNVYSGPTPNSGNSIPGTTQPTTLTPSLTPGSTLNTGPTTSPTTTPGTNP